MEPIYGLLLGLSWIPLCYFTRNSSSVLRTFCFIYSIPTIILGLCIFSGIPKFLAGDATLDISLIFSTVSAFFLYSALVAVGLTFISFAVIDVSSCSKGKTLSSMTYFCVANVILTVSFLCVSLTYMSPVESPRYEVVIDKHSYGSSEMLHEDSKVDLDSALRESIDMVRSSCLTANVALKAPDGAVVSCIQGGELNIRTPNQPFSLFSPLGVSVSDNVSRATVAPLNEEQLKVTIFTKNGLPPMSINEVSNIIDIIFYNTWSDVEKNINDGYWGESKVIDKELVK
ncbi:hypothetical protein [Vibrio coralliirubri]|uniref:hypothetical protein n=1 Tax=Vibrio coralliirubri TaxID=1516159 RepID=UPI0022851B5E|nr:hypothetical protein [Vibrio coralliirubri]